MRLAITIAKGEDGDYYVRTGKGDWLCIGDPSGKLGDEKAYVKALTLKGGLEGEMQFSEAYVLSNMRMEMKKRFNPDLPKNIEESKQRSKALMVKAVKAEIERLASLSIKDLTIVVLNEDLKIDVSKSADAESLAKAIVAAREVKVANGGTVSDQDEAEEAPLNTMKRPVLEKLVEDEELEIDVKEDKNKPLLIAAIEDARKAKADKPLTE